MGLIQSLLALLFGPGRNAVVETAEVFRENAEAASARDAAQRAAALSQFAAEFGLPRRGAFDRLMDALNRVPRPALALGTLGLFAAAMTDPVWFSARMQGIALVPEPLWWLMGAIVSFYFGARAQTKAQEFQAAIAQTLARTTEVTENLAALEALARGAGAQASDVTAGAAPGAAADNPALDEIGARLVSASGGGSGGRAQTMQREGPDGQ